MLRPEEAHRPWSVSELAQQIRAQLRPLTTVFVKGEVTGMRRGAKGHYSFAIKDRGATVEAFLWADDARRLPMLPEDGQEFIFKGRIDFWPQGGRLRLIVEYLEFDDIGKLRAQLEQLKQRLELEGAFEAGRKRPLPFLPDRVALITSPTGAVIHDLQETIWDRFPNLEVLVYPAQVQGMASPGSVVAALRRCNREGLADVVIIARGGGSFEELYAFNTEPVARAILASLIPVVTALGHTSDRTLADMVADAECRTPTEAGARVVPKKTDLLAQLADRHRRLTREWQVRLTRHSDGLSALSERLHRVLAALLRERAVRLARCQTELARLSPMQQLERRRSDLADRGRRLEAAAAGVLRLRQSALQGRRADDALRRLIDDRLRAAERALSHRAQRLVALSPEAVLSRGYSITQDADSGTVIKEAGATGSGRQVRIRLAAGRLLARVEEVGR